MLSINPHAATIEDIARMASELVEIWQSKIHPEVKTVSATVERVK